MEQPASSSSTISPTIVTVPTATVSAQPIDLSSGGLTESNKIVLGLALSIPLAALVVAILTCVNGWRGRHRIFIASDGQPPRYNMHLFWRL
jgi:hypothetical protein